MGIYRYLKDVNKQLLQTQVSKNHLSAGTLEMNLKGFPVFFFFFFFLVGVGGVDHKYREITDFCRYSPSIFRAAFFGGVLEAPGHRDPVPVQYVCTSRSESW